MQRNETTATSTVLLNGEQAKNQLEILEAKVKSLRKSIRESENIGDIAGVKKYNKELKSTQREMKQVRSEAFDAKKVLDNLSGSSAKDLEQALKKIQSLMKNGTVKRHSKDWDELRDAKIRVTKELKKVNAEMGIGESRASKLANGMNKYFSILTAGVAALTGIVVSLKSAAKEAARMSDVYGQVQKYTGESAEGVAALNDELKKMNTRTSREELNRLLGEAGKLGVEGKENLLQFAKAADIIQVSLGDDLGEDAVKNIGKLTYMFGVQQKMGMEKSMLAVGSAINEVGQKSTASEAYLLEFTNRLSGMGVAAGMTIPQIIGFGSVLDQNAQQVEMSATAMNKFISTLATDSEKIANAVGIPAAKLKKAVGEDMNAALMLVFEQLNKKGGLVDLAPLFSELGAEGARAASVITILASKYKDLGAEQLLALNSFNAGTSVIKEFGVQNNTMQARLDKSKKAFLDASETLGKSLSPAFLHSTNAAVYMIKALADLPKWLNENKGLLLTLVAALGAYGTILGICKLESLSLMAVEKARILVQKISTAATLAQVAVTGYLTGATRVANLATKQFFATLGLNPFVAIGAAIALVTIGLYKLGTAKTAAEKAYKEYNAQMQVEITKSDQLFDAVKKTTKGSDERKQLIEKINTIYGDYLENQLSEKSNLDEINIAQQKVNQSLREKIGLQIKESSKADIIANAMPDQIKILDQLSSSISATEGDVVAEIITSKIQNILKAGGYTDKAISVAQKYLKNKLGKNFTAGMEFYPAMLAKSIKTMNNDLSDVDKKFDRIIGKATSTSAKTQENETPSIDGKNLSDSGKKLTKEELYDKDLKLLELTRKKEELVNKKAYADETVNEEVFREWQYQAKLEFLAEKLALDKKYGKDTIDTENEIADTINSEKEYWNNKIIQEAEKLKKDEQKDNKDKEREVKEHLERIAQIRREFGLNTLRLTYSQELELLNEKLAEEKASEEETAMAIADFKKRVAEDYVNDYAAVAGKASAALNNLVEMETIAVETKYAKEIEAAEKAGKDTTELQERSEREKKDIKKKYALIDFLITNSRIVAETAAAIMKAAPNVPLQIAEGILGATQLGIATAEYNSVKNLWTGGFTDPGDKYKPAGIVHAGEFVANQDAVGNRTLRRLFNVIDYAQKNNTVGRIDSSTIARALQMKQGFSSGGFTASGTATGADVQVINYAEVVSALHSANAVNSALLAELQKGIRAKVAIRGSEGLEETTELYDKLMTNVTKK